MEQTEILVRTYDSLSDTYDSLSELKPPGGIVLLLTLSLVTFAAQADPYLPMYSDASSDDIVELHNDEPIRLLPDIDGDARPEALTVGSEQNCTASIIHLSSAQSDGAFTSEQSDSQWRLFHSGEGCAVPGHTEVIGDINGDGRRDLVFVQNNYFDTFRQTAVIITPSRSGSIDVSGLDGSNGFILEGGPVVDDAGDVNGDGKDELVIGGQLVVAGASGFESSYALYAKPDGVLIDSTLSGGGFRNAGDLNGDGYGDLLLGHINSTNKYAVLYGKADLSRTITSDADLEIGGGTFMFECAYSFSCSITPIGDIDGDGHDDLSVSFFGCGYAQYAALLYGSSTGLPLHDYLDDYASGEMTRVVDSISGGCLSGDISGSPGDMDGDGLRDIAISYLQGERSAAVVFGPGASRPDYLSVDAMDGTSGVSLAFDGHFVNTYNSRDALGLDINGDGFADLLDNDDSHYYTSDDEILENFKPFGLALRGKPRGLDDKGPTSLVIEQVDAGWLVRWQPPVSGTVSRYELLIDDIPTASFDSTARDFLLSEGDVTPPFAVNVHAKAADGSLIGSSLRQIARRVEGEQLEATVYGPTLIELSFNRLAPWTARTVRYQVWRNCDLLTLAQENADSYWDATVQPGQSYTYFLRPIYSRFNEVDSAADLRDYPPVQRRSNSVTVVTPGGSSTIAAMPLDCLDGATSDTGDTGDTEPTVAEKVRIVGLQISWTTDGWHQVQSLDDYTTWCEGGSECTVEPGTYVVINHGTGERIEPVIVREAPEVDGTTIYWSADDDWYQVQDATTYESLCQGGNSCDVLPGTYIVINHSTGQRWEGVEVMAPASVSVVGQVIVVPDDGWYQVQDAQTYASVCEGVLTCSVPSGSYIVINHTSGVRYESVQVN